MLIFSLDGGTDLARALSTRLAQPLADFEDRAFEDGEHKWRPLCDPRAQQVFVLASLHGRPDASPHDALCRLLMFIGTLRDHGAARITALVPYLAYARKDRRTQPFDPLALRYVAQMFEAVGTDELVVLDAHNSAALQNAFRVPTQLLEAHQAFQTVARAIAEHGPCAVASPDPGGVKRAQLWREALETELSQPLGFAVVDKRRRAGQVTGQHLVAGDVEGCTVLLLDDLIASGETMVRAAIALRLAGAREVVAFAAHGLFTGDACLVLGDPAISRVVVTNSVPSFRVPADSALAGKLTVVSAAALFSEAVSERCSSIPAAPPIR
ncbi:ribose-phosphate diphosphokinase [Hydrogenophaga sp. PBL-H3]|uniref:ribose-phosphate diphosphokinase n=1 Tax=Hydrogenophaga sp. PBL-H3 TaxID=434010 RepID=UPI001320425C|nr:ribose-phosphate diphosphokinase [Hydrogenophaga sp. PBL-H3]QHE75037.1 ribose-phosphate pyrophosphokinase [Hydrogenophaga sp. PBL-H3]QHE79464.1 ribose-phosphate pyrophosphokinase [Hydrogenophaga sp. PBL-H3]